MILITGKAKLQADQRDAAIAAASKMSAASMAEAGCHDYRFWTLVDDPTSMLLLEQWEDQASLDAHFVQPHMGEFIAAIGPTLDGGMDITKFEIASFGPL
jgi:quinol monooxygenase YgiN